MVGPIAQGGAGGIAAGELTQQRLQIPAMAEALQIPHQGQGAIGATAPAHAGAILQAYGHQHGMRFRRKAFNHAIARGVQSERAQGVAETADIPQDGWQDREMGQGFNAH